MVWDATHSGLLMTNGIHYTCVTLDKYGSYIWVTKFGTKVIVVLFAEGWIKYWVWPVFYTSSSNPWCWDIRPVRRLSIFA